jgi:hypothetical protein
MVKKRKGEKPPKKSALEVRKEVRDWIQNERETICTKWLALEQHVQKEDVAREKFIVKRTQEDTRMLPMTIQKFIGSIKRAVQKTLIKGIGA